LVQGFKVAAALDHDGFGLKQSKTINVIAPKYLERNLREKAVATFSHSAVAALVLASGLVGCGKHEAAAPAAPGAKPLTSAQQTASAINDADLSKITPPATGPGAYDPATLRLQVLLDRARFSPGVIDGRANDNLRRAVAAFQAANGIQGDGTPTKQIGDLLTKADPRPAMRNYIIDADAVAGPFTPDIPKDFPGMARLMLMGYRGPAEELAEAFHMQVDLLVALNPGATFRAGTTLLVADRGGDDLGADLGALEVDKAAGVIKASGKDGKLLSVYPASMGSPTCPAAAGTLEVRTVFAQPTYSYDSDSLAVAGAVRGRTEIAAGPNNPLGVVWINLSKDGFGIHGAPDPDVVGKPQAHGCIRLTNWDARELARGVSPGVKVVFK
jgi:lipoprotein-anchoring transpeptidase ErfK/SrfK